MLSRARATQSSELSALSAITRDGRVRSVRYISGDTATTSAIAPSSRFLARAIVKDLDLGSAGAVLELVDGATRRRTFPVTGPLSILNFEDAILKIEDGYVGQPGFGPTFESTSH